MATKYELAHRVWPILLRAARDRRVLTYGELAQRLGHGGATATRYPLWAIADFCDERGLPPLTSLVVNQDTGRPGPGFDYWEGPLQEAHRRVFGFPGWANIEPPFPPGTLATLNGMNGSDGDSFDVPDQQVMTNGRGPYQSKFRARLLRIYDWQCALCETWLEEMLIGAHIKPWGEDPKNRLNPRNGILLCRTHDCLFEAGIIKIAPSGGLSWSGVSKQAVGGDLYETLKNRTAAKLRMPEKKYRPDPAFLQWRLDNPRRCSIESEA